MTHLNHEEIVEQLEAEIERIKKKNSLLHIRIQRARTEIALMRNKLSEIRDLMKKFDELDIECDDELD